MLTVITDDSAAEDLLRALQINAQQQFEILTANSLFWRDGQPTNDDTRSLVEL
jgi:hypothetical protein